VYIFRNFIKRVAKQKIYQKKVKISNLLTIEVNFTSLQKQSPKNSKKKGNKFNMAVELFSDRSLNFGYNFRNFIKRVAKQKIYQKKGKISNLLAIELIFAFTQKQRPNNSKKKGTKFKKFNMASQLLPIVTLSLSTFFESL